MTSPTCPHCNLPTVFLHQTKQDHVRSGRSVFECRSCFRLISQPVTYVLKPVA